MKTMLSILLMIATLLLGTCTPMFHPRRGPMADTAGFHADTALLCTESLPGAGLPALVPSLANL